MTKKRKHAIYFPDDGLTRPSFQDECNVNNIISTYANTGMVNHVARAKPQWGDAPDQTFHEAMCTAADLASQQEAGTLDLDDITDEPPQEEEAPEKEPEKGSEEPSGDPESTTEDGDLT